MTCQFQGQAGDEMDDGQMPMPLPPWEIPFKPTQDFKDEVCQIEVPNTTTILVGPNCLFATTFDLFR